MLASDYRCLIGEIIGPAAERVARDAGGGRIIAIGSRAAEDPGPKVGAYSASKAALVSLIRTVALENKDAGSTSNVILHGTIDTPANRKDMPGADISQWVQPSSVASLIGWLAGDAGKDVFVHISAVERAGLSCTSDNEFRNGL